MPLQSRFSRAVSRLFVLLVLLAGGLAVHAQTETPTALKDVTIAVTVANRTTRLAAELIGLPVQNRLQDDFVPAGYRVVRAQPDQAQLWVKLTPEADQTLTTTITIADDFLPTLPSDVLVPALEPIAFTAPKSDALTATISDVTLALNIALQTCVSTPIRGDGLTDFAIGLITSAIDFYAANCSLAAGDLIRAGAQYQETLASMALTSVTMRIPPTVNLAWLAYKDNRATAGIEMLDDLLAQSKFISDRMAIIRKRSAFRALTFQFDDAIADMKAVVTEYPNDASAYVELGQRILLTYEWNQVLDAYDKAIAVDPTYAPAYFQRGVLFYTEGPRANALKDFQKYLELAPDGEYANDAQTYIGGIEQTTAGEIQQGK